MVVLKGEIVLRVDGGVEEVVREGEMAVQRGNIHAVSHDSFAALLKDRSPLLLMDCGRGLCA